MASAGEITFQVEVRGFLGPMRRTLALWAVKSAPCPTCHLPGGFHDHDDHWIESKHLAHEVPRDLVRPSNTQLRRERRIARATGPGTATFLGEITEDERCYLALNFMLGVVEATE